MISSIVLKFGRSPKSPAEVIKVTPLTVFVGPNNSGKSKLLTELNQYCRSGSYSATSLILAEVGFDGLTEQTVSSVIDRLQSKPNQTKAKISSKITLLSLVNMVDSRFIVRLTHRFCRCPLGISATSVIII